MPSTQTPTEAMGPPSAGSHDQSTAGFSPRATGIACHDMAPAVRNAPAMARIETAAAGCPRRRSGRISPMARKLAKGSASTSSASSGEPMRTLSPAVDRGGRPRSSAHAEDHDDDGEADRDFGHRDRDGEQREDEPGQVGAEAREGDEVDVHRVEHQLDAEQDADSVPARQHAEEADDEDERGEHEVGVERHPQSSARAK